MSSTYNSNPAATQAPSSTPGPRTSPTVTMPADGDPDSAATFAQGFKVLADDISYVKTGRVSQVREEWFVLPTATQSVWTNVVGAGGSFTAQAPTANFNGRFVQFNPANSGLYSVGELGPIILANTSLMSFMLEFEFGMNANAAGVLSNVTYYMGLTPGVDPFNDLNNILLRKRYNVANYEVFTGDGAGNHTIPTGVAPTVGTYPTDKIRIEIQGAGSPSGVYQAKFTINGTVTTQTAANLPGAQAMRLIFGSYSEGGAPTGSPLGWVGPVFATWNRFQPAAGL